MDRLRDADPVAEAGVDERGEADLQLILEGEVVAPMTSSADGRRSRSPRRPFAVAAAVVLGLVAVGAGVHSLTTRDGGGVQATSAAAPGPAESPASSAADVPAAAGPSSAALVGPAPDAQTLLDATSTGAAYDYDVAATPSELAETADLVTIGSVVGVTIEGPAVSCDDPAGPSSGTEGVLLRLGDLQVAQGRPGGDTVEVAVPLGGEEALQSALPLGTRVLVYASPGTAADCAPVLRATGPQSLAVQAAGGQVVWPMLGAVRTGELAQALPDGSLIAP